MKFAQDYKYRHIPFCSLCAAHTKFTPVQNNRVVGAVTIDNPNSNIDPTYVATRTETKLVCNTCGSEMFKWSEKESATDEYFKQFYNQEEARKNDTEGSAGGCFISLLLAFLISIPLVSLTEKAFDSPSLELGQFLFFLYICLFGLVFFVIIIQFILVPRHNKKNHKKITTLGKGVNGETVIFYQETGQIEYKR